MKIILYSTECSKCFILKDELDAKKLEYQIITDRQTMIDLGMKTAPGLRIDDVLMDFAEAMEWVAKQEGI